LCRGEVNAGFSVEKPEGNNHFEDLGIIWRLTLKWILKKWPGRA